MKKSVKKIVKSIVGAMKSRFDKEGSYTGNAEDGDKPTQDADDL